MAFGRRERAKELLAALTIACLTLMSPPAAVAEGKSAGPHFSLFDQNDKPVTDLSLQGRPTLVQFGFTRCPVVCPTTLYELAQIMEELGPVSDQINFVFVTVDPERDTSAVLKEYVGSFDERIIALTGSSSQIANLASGVGATFSKQPTATDYTMDHTVHAFLLDRHWTLAQTIYVGPDSDHVRFKAELQRLLK